MYWQRVNQPNVPHGSGGSDHRERSTAGRPPSYVSDDGVEYILEAQPRSMIAEVHLPTHPSERGRILPSQLSLRRG